MKVIFKALNVTPTFFLLIILSLFFSPTKGEGGTSVLDWDIEYGVGGTVYDTSGPTGSSKTIDGVQIDISGQLVGPVVDGTTTNGQVVGSLVGNQTNVLRMSIDDSKELSEYLEVQFDFSIPVVDLEFTLLDVDATDVAAPTRFFDAIRVIYDSEALSGANILDTLPSNGSITFTNPVVETAIGADSRFRGNDAASGSETTGNVVLNFGDERVTSFRILYSNDDAVSNAETLRQLLALSDLTFTPVPEPSTYLMLGTCLLLVSIAKRKKKLPKHKRLKP